MSQSPASSQKAASSYPAAIRVRPDYFVGEPGRHAVYYLIDQLIRCLIWGTDRSRLGAISLSVETDGTLTIERNWPGENTVFPELGADIAPVGISSILAEHFQRCVGGIGSGQHHRMDWKRGNPYTSIFLAVAGALSSRAKITVTAGGATVSQTFREGEPVELVARSAADQGASMVVELLLDSELLQEDIPAYPFRIRLRELACILPGLSVKLQYKGFKPLEICSEKGMEDLLCFYVPVEDRIHECPFNFHFQDAGLDYRCSLFLIRSEMERVKAFASLDESYHGGVHERVLRRVVRQVVRRLHKLEIPERRQSYDNIASSRMSYFGKFGATIPFRREQSKTEYVRTVPGLAATIHVDSPDLEWETNYRARLAQPEMLKTVRLDLLDDFRRWVLDHPLVIKEWHNQWAPKRRARRKKPSPKPQEAVPGNLEDVPAVAAAVADEATEDETEEALAETEEFVAEPEAIDES